MLFLMVFYFRSNTFDYLLYRVFKDFSMTGIWNSVVDSFGRNTPGHGFKPDYDKIKG